MPERSSEYQLREAMLIQKRSVRALSIMITAAAQPTDRELLAAVQREELRHYYLLEGIYEDIVNQPAQMNTASVSLPKGFVEMLKTAICDKLAAIDLYESLLLDLECERHQWLLNIIIQDQKEHARILAGIYNRDHED